MSVNFPHVIFNLTCWTVKLFDFAEIREQLAATNELKDLQKNEENIKNRFESYTTAQADDVALNEEKIPMLFRSFSHCYNRINYNLVVARERIGAHIRKSNKEKSSKLDRKFCSRASGNKEAARTICKMWMSDENK